VTRWVRRFDYPEQGWLQLVVNSPDGPERAAREVADREGEGMREYADAVYPELKALWEGMREQQAAPVAVYVPPVPLNARPLVPITAYVQGLWQPPEERGLEAIAEQLSQPQPYRLGQAQVSVVKLPAGPACRLHEAVLHDAGDAGDDGRRLVIEHIDYYLLPPECPEGVFKLSVNWSSLVIGAEMVATADVMAASLTVRREQAEAVGAGRPLAKLDEGAER
jgi:hypothetical protein